MGGAGTAAYVVQSPAVATLKSLVNAMAASTLYAVRYAIYSDDSTAGRMW